MARKRIYLAFLLILGLLAFSACARYDVMPDRNLRDRVLDNNDHIRNDGALDGMDFNRNNTGTNLNR